MFVKFAVSLFVVLLPLAGFLYSREGVSHKQAIPETAERDIFKALSIERLSEPAPDFTLKDLQGRPVSLNVFLGKVVFLNFWATWCPPCRREMPTMERLHQKFGDQGLVVLGINFGESLEEIRSFYEEHRLTFPALQDESVKAFELYEAWSLPTTYLINRQGKIVGKVIGYRDWGADLARSFFRQLLESPS